MKVLDIVMNAIIDLNFAIIVFLKFMKLNNLNMWINICIVWDVIKIDFVLDAIVEYLVIEIKLWDIVMNVKKRDANNAKNNSLNMKWNLKEILMCIKGIVKVVA